VTVRRYVHPDQVYRVLRSAGNAGPMRAMRPLIPVACLVALAITGCSDDDPAAPTVAGLAGKTFESTVVDGHPMAAGTNVTMSFDADGVAVNAGCNTLRGAVTIEDGVLQVGPMAQTMMACTDDLMTQDTFLGEFFTAGPAITLDGRTLTLTGSGATITAAVTAD
jgi:heat shock protein HslJ